MKKYVIAAAVFIVLGVGSGLWLSKNKSTVYLPLKRGTIDEAVYGLGRVKSRRVFELKLGVVEAIQKLHVSEGDQVTFGTPLVKFHGGLSFKAPFAGTVTSAPFHEGENVFPQTTVLKIEDLSDLFVEVSLEQQGALRIKKGQKALLSFESLRAATIEGHVDSIYPKDDQFVVKIDSKKLPEGIFPGMTADVAIQVGRKENALLIPLAAVNGGRVIVQRNGSKKKMAVTIGSVDDSWGEVLEGELQPDDLVATPKK